MAASVEDNRAMIVAIERELALLAAERAQNAAALKAALAHAHSQGRAGSSTRRGGASPSRTGAIGPQASVSSAASQTPLRGVARSAWEASVVEDELSRPLMIPAETMRAWAAEEDAAERRLASECAVHLTQLARLRDKLRQRSAHATRMEAYTQLKERSGTSALSTPDLSDGSIAEPGGGKASVVSMGARTTAAVSASLARLEQLEQRIAELESGIAPSAGVLPAAASLGIVDENMVYDMEGPGGSGDDATFITQSTTMGSERHRTLAPDAGTGTPATPLQHADHPQHTSGAAATGAAQPMGVPILAAMAAGTRTGKHTMSSPYVTSGKAGKKPDQRGRGGSVTRDARSAAGVSGSMVLPAVATAPLLGLLFKREVSRQGVADPGRVMYSVQRLATPFDSVLGPQASGIIPSASYDGSMSRNASRTGVGTNADSNDPIEKWLAAKRTQNQAAPATGGPSGSVVSQSSVRGRGSGVAAVRAQRAQPVQQSVSPTLGKSISPPRGRPQVPGKQAGVSAAIDATRGRATSKPPVKTMSGAPSSTVRQGARTAVRSTAMAQFTDIRKRFAEQQQDVRSNLVRAPTNAAPRAGAAARPAGTTMKAQTLPARSVSVPPRGAATQGGAQGPRGVVTSTLRGTGAAAARPARAASNAPTRRPAERAVGGLASGGPMGVRGNAPGAGTAKLPPLARTMPAGRR